MFFNNKFNKVRTSFFCLVYIICAILQSFVSKGTFSSWDALTTTSINGCISAIKLCLVLLIIICSNGKHFLTSICIQVANILYTIVGIVKSQNFEIVPGILLLLFGILLCVIIEKYISKVKQNEEHLDKIIYIDPLTECLNRRGLIRELNLKASLGKEFYLIFLDLDNFKQVNDILGHHVGDQLLKDISERWSNLPFENYVLSRLGGDEFAIIVESEDKKYMDRFIKTLLKSMESIDPKFSSIITASAGIAHHTKDTSDVKQLLVYADTAMYGAKKAGKNTYRYFDMKAYKELEKRYLTEEDVRHALVYGSFEVLYQPQFDVHTHALIGLEALLRMRDKNGKFVDTQNFINVAEKSGLIYDIDLWVVKNVLRKTVSFIKSHPNVELSINISGKHIIAPGFHEYVHKCLQDVDFPPSQLKIEITESSYLKNLDEAVKVINILKSLGIRIALDDFGTGYSSLSYLSRIPVDLLKIDKSFIDNIEFEKHKSNFVDVIIKLGHLMGCKVLAEGVEKEEQLETLVMLNIDYVQGFIWSKPKTLDEIIKYEIDNNIQ